MQELYAIFHVQRGSYVNQRHRGDRSVALNENRALQKDRTWSEHCVCLPNNLWEREGSHTDFVYCHFPVIFQWKVTVCGGHTARSREV